MGSDSMTRSKVYHVALEEPRGLLDLPAYAPPKQTEPTRMKAGPHSALETAVQRIAKSRASYIDNG